METAKALAKAVRTMQARGADLLTRLEEAQANYDREEKSETRSNTKLVTLAGAVNHAQSEYDSNHEAITAIQVLEAAITRL